MKWEASTWISEDWRSEIVWYRNRQEDQWLAWSNCAHRWFKTCDEAKAWCESRMQKHDPERDGEVQG